MSDARPFLTVALGALAAAAVSAVVAAAAVTPAPPRLPAEGGLSFDVRDAQDRRAHPLQADAGRRRRHARSGAHPRRHRTPRERGDDRRLQPPDVADRFGVAHVPVGTYDVTVSRGPEWDIFTVRRLKLTSRGAVVTARLNHVVDTHDWLSADFHVHAARSPDSRVPMQDRILRVRRRRRADDRGHRPQRDLRLRAVHPRARCRALHRERGRRRADHRRLGTLRRVPAAARSRAPRAGRGAGPSPPPRRLLQGRARERARRDHRRAPPAHRRRDRLLRHRAVRRPLRSGRPPRVLLGLRRGRGDERLPGSGAAQRRPRGRRLVLAAQPRPPGDRDRQLRHPPPDLQHRRLPAQLRQAARRPPRARRPQGGRGRGARSPRVLHHRPLRDPGGRGRHHRRSRSRPGRQGAGRDRPSRPRPGSPSTG